MGLVQTGADPFRKPKDSFFNGAASLPEPLFL